MTFLYNEGQGEDDWDPIGGGTTVKEADHLYKLSNPDDSTAAFITDNRVDLAEWDVIRSNVNVPTMLGSDSRYDLYITNNSDGSSPTEIASITSTTDGREDITLNVSDVDDELFVVVRTFYGPGQSPPGENDEVEAETYQVELIETDVEVSGIVSLEGQPVEGATVIGIDDTLGIINSTVQTNENGEYTLGFPEEHVAHIKVQYEDPGTGELYNDESNPFIVAEEL